MGRQGYGETTRLAPSAPDRYASSMDSIERFDGHLRKIAETAARLTPRVVAMRPKTVEGRTVVYIEIDACPIRLWMQLSESMDQFCRREGIPPDFTFSNRTALPAEFRGASATPADDLPAAWPPDAH
jgi:hypothetical protein